MTFREDPQTKDIPQGVKLRSMVDRVVNEDIKAAYELARTIKHPWYRCQALAKVSEYSSKSFTERILQESFNSAMLCHDENRQVSVACWPLGVAIQRHLSGLAKSFLVRCIEQVNQEIDPISKWCAASVVQTVKSNPDLLKLFYHTFVSATSRGHGWRVEREIKQLLSDPEIRKDESYVSYLLNRQLEIQTWKDENSIKIST